MSVQPWLRINAYETLGLTPDADPEAIRLAWRRASRAAHPDRGGSHEAQVRVNLALEILNDPHARAAHDRHWRGQISVAPPMGPAREGAIADLFRGYRPTTSRFFDDRRGSGLARRVEERLARDRQRIERDMDARREEHRRRLGRAYRRTQFDGLLAVTATAVFAGAAVHLPALAIAAVPCAWHAARRLRGVAVGEIILSIADPRAGTKLTLHAEHLAQESCRRDVAVGRDLSGPTERIRHLLLSPLVDPRDPTELARRALAAFFVLGYQRDTESDGPDVARFRRGAETALLYYKLDTNRQVGEPTVERWLSRARGERGVTVWVYAPGGFTANAAGRCDRADARALDAAGFEAWTRSLWHSDLAGPDGDIAILLQKLSHQLQMPA